MTPIIGLTGLAGAGKSTAARWLNEHHRYAILPFASPLKAMAAAVLTSEQMHGRLKEVPSDALCGLSPRQFMQRLGTEFGRDQVGRDFWVKQWLQARLPICNSRIVADDVRFTNEAQAVRMLGGIIIEVRREGAGSASGAGHISEAMPVEPDWIIEAQDVADLERQLAGLWD